MNNEKTITICGKEVKMRYCAAAETGFEQMSSKSIGDIDFKARGDLIRLSFSSILAAYLRSDIKTPVTITDILSDAKPKEIADMFTTLAEIRKAWYEVPSVVEPEMEEDAQSETEKNA